MMMMITKKKSALSKLVDIKWYGIHKDWHITFHYEIILNNLRKHQKKYLHRIGMR